MKLTAVEKQIRILLLEDDPTDAELCLRKLRHAGMQVAVEIVGSAEHFKDHVKKNHYDIILGDYRLPSWTGLEAVRWLRSENNRTPFILVTGTLGDELAVECIREGASDYVLKEKLDRLPFAIQRALDDQRMRAAREEAERDLRRSEQQFASIVSNAPYGIYRANRQGQILMVNPAMVSMLGYDSEQEMIGLDLENDVYWDAKERNKLLAHLPDPSRPDAAAADHLCQMEIQWRRKDGKQIFVRVAGRLLPARNSEIEYEVFAQDVTEQRTLEREFQQAQKMEAIGRLAGGVAHDFNNLLMIIRGCAELLDYHKGQPDKVNAYLKQINDATSIAASVVQQLLMFSRKQSPEPMVIDMNSVLKSLGKMLPRLLGEDVAVEFKYGLNLGRISADRSQIEQIVLNLAVNARDAMPKGGMLVVETRNDYLDEQQAYQMSPELKPGNYVIMAIKDNGVGMDAEVQSHIFEPFFTTKERGKGTGLGLATVYGIVRQSGGHITVKSVMGEGTTFKIFFPCAASKEVAQSPQLVAPAVGGSETILLVEDEAALREITQEYLQSKGYNVLAANNGMQALEVCRSHPGAISLLLTDIIMPGIAGPAMVEAALKMRPDLHVIYVSGYSDRGVSEEELGPRAAFLRKPYGLAELGQKIRSAINAPTSASAAS